MTKLSDLVLRKFLRAELGYGGLSYIQSSEMSYSFRAPPSFLRYVGGYVFIPRQWLFLLTVTLALLSSSEDTIATSWSLLPILSSVPCACFLSEIPLFPAAAATRDALRA